MDACLLFRAPKQLQHSRMRGSLLVPKRGKGSDIILHHPASQILLSVPSHKEIKRGTLRALIRDSGLTVEQFRALL